MKNTGVLLLLRLNVLVCTLATISASGQGTALQFCNGCLPSPPDRLVRDVNGNPLVGTSYVAQLYMGASPDNLIPTTAAPARFRAPGSSQPGTWTPKAITITGIGPGAIYLQVRVWDTSIAATYNEAAASVTGQFGRSAVFAYNPCPPPTQPPAPPGCDLMLGFLGFTLMTNPSPGMLAIRENGDRVDVVYEGSHTIQAAGSIRGPWSTVHSGPGPFTDPNSGTFTLQFYRMRDEPGPTYSVNAVGYYRLNLCSGFSLIANQLQHVGGNRVENIFNQPPEGARVFKFRPDNWIYEMMQYVDGAWEGEAGMTLNPGEGAFLWSPTVYNNRFLGELSARTTITIPNGISIVSSPLPEIGSLSALGFPLRNGDQIFQWYCYRPTYLYNSYLDGEWEGDNGGTPPTVDIGEAFFVIRTGGGAGTWTRDFSVGP